MKFLKQLKQEQEEEKTKIKALQTERMNLEEEVQKLSKRQIEIQNQIDQDLENFRLSQSGFNILEEVGYERYTPIYPEDIIERKIYWAENKMARMMGEGSIIQYDRTYRIDSSESKGKKFQENYGKNLIIGFNSYVKSKIKLITQDNYYKNRELIKKAYEKYNKQGDLLGIKLNPYYLNLQLNILQYTLEFKIKKQKEKAQFREERKRMREQEKLLEEARKEKEKLEAQRKAEDIAYAKALTDEERAQIKANIKALDKRIDDINYRVNNPKAGWVYIIHSPSLPDMVKIGVSRRLNGPYERISELSSSSLPLPFVLDGFCFSDDAFAIESAMHEYFDSVRVVQNREFFYTTSQNAINVLQNVFHQKVILSELEMSELETNDYKTN